MLYLNLLQDIKRYYLPYFQSYGGFVTAHALGDERDDVFNCGIAIAPVTDWRYYGAINCKLYSDFTQEML